MILDSADTGSMSRTEVYSHAYQCFVEFSSSERDSRCDEITTELRMVSAPWDIDTRCGIRLKTVISDDSLFGGFVGGFQRCFDVTKWTFSVPEMDFLTF